MTNQSNLLQELFDILTAQPSRVSQGVENATGGASQAFSHPAQDLVNAFTYLLGEDTQGQSCAPCGEPSACPGECKEDDTQDDTYTLHYDLEGHDIPVVVLTDESMLRGGVLQALLEGEQRDILAAVDGYEYDEEFSYKGNVRKALDKFFAESEVEVGLHLLDTTPGALTSRADTLEEVAAFIDTLEIIVSDDQYAGFVEFPADITLEVLGEYGDVVDTIIPAGGNTIVGVESTSIEEILAMTELL